MVRLLWWWKMSYKAWRTIEILGDLLRFEPVPTTLGVMDWMFVSPQNLYVEALNAWWDGIWRWDLWEVISLDEVLRVGPSLMKKEDTSVSLSLPTPPSTFFHPSLLSSLPFSLCTCTAERPWGHTVWRWPSASQERSSFQELSLPAPSLSGSWPWELWKINVCCLSHTVYGILF